MKVKDLIRKLSEFNDDCDVVIAKDGEGNDFSPLDSMSKGHYFPETTWSGEFHDEGRFQEWQEDIGQGGYF